MSSQGAMLLTSSKTQRKLPTLFYPRVLRAFGLFQGGAATAKATFALSTVERHL